MHAPTRRASRRTSAGGKWPFVECVEIGNGTGPPRRRDLPSPFQSDGSWHSRRQSEAQDRHLDTEAGGSDRYWEGDIFKPHLESIDALRIHRYALEEAGPTWRCTRRYPEDSSAPYFFSKIQDMIDWR